MTIWICRWRMNTLVTSQYQTRLSSITKVFSRRISQSDSKIKLNYSNIRSTLLTICQFPFIILNLSFFVTRIMRLSWYSNPRVNIFYSYWWLSLTIFYAAGNGEFRRTCKAFWWRIENALYFHTSSNCWCVSKSFQLQRFIENSFSVRFKTVICLKRIRHTIVWI